MEWLAGIIALGIALYWWRVTLPIVVIVSVGAGIYTWKEDRERNARQSAEKIKEQERAKKIAIAFSTATSEGRVWKPVSEKDPASDKWIYRTARVNSNDGLCHLTVERRIDGTELSGLSCELLQVAGAYDFEPEVNIKFSHLDQSHRMIIEKYSGGSWGYLGQQPSYKGYLMPYNKFVEGLKQGNAVAVRTKEFNGRWVTFSLNGAASAILLLGKEAPPFNPDEYLKKNDNLPSPPPGFVIVK